MYQVVEVSAAVAGGRIPLGLVTVKQALELPDVADFRFRHASDKDTSPKSLSRQELEIMALKAP